MPTPPTRQPWSLVIFAVVAVSAVSAACDGDAFNDLSAVAGVVCDPMTGRVVANERIDLTSVDAGASLLPARTVVSDTNGFFFANGGV